MPARSLLTPRLIAAGATACLIAGIVGPATAATPAATSARPAAGVASSTVDLL